MKSQEGLEEQALAGFPGKLAAFCPPRMKQEKVGGGGPPGSIAFENVPSRCDPGFRSFPAPTKLETGC